MEIEEVSVNDNSSSFNINDKLLNEWMKSTLNGELTCGEHIIRSGICAFSIGKLEDVPEYVSMYHINDVDCYNSAIIFLKNNIKGIFEKLLKMETKSENTTKRILVHKSSRWNDLKNLIETYLSNLNYFLGRLNDPNMQIFVLQHIDELILYYIPFSELQNELLNVLLTHLCSKDENVRIETFLLIRKLVYEFPYPFIENVLRETYITYTKFSSILTSENKQIIEFLIECFVELYGVDFVVSYKIAHEFIQDLFKTVEKAKDSSDIEDYIYNWKHINSLNAWVHVLSEYPHQDELKQLLHLLVQTIEETMCIKSKEIYIPLKLHCTKMLIHVVKKTETYINVLPYILYNFESRYLLNEEKKIVEKRHDLEFLLKFPKNQVEGIGQYSNQLFNQSINILVEYLLSYISSIAFPELSFTVTVSLTKFMNRTKNAQYKKEIKNLLEKIESISSVIQTKRGGLNMSIQEVLESNSHLIDVQTHITKLKQIKRAMSNQAFYVLLNIALVMSFPSLLNATFQTREYLMHRMKDSNACTLASKYGYPCETHETVTKDGYILTLHRYPVNNTQTRKGVVLFQHGLTDSSSGVSLNKPHESLSYILRDAGYDVWLGNNRGNGQSMKHVKYTIHDKEFWDFCTDEMALYDLPAEIDYVLNFTRSKKLTYIGHSEGTIQAFSGFLDRNLSEKVNIFIALAPVAYVGNIDVFFVRLLAYFHTDTLFKLLGLHEFWIPDVIHKLLPGFCNIFKFICEFILTLVSGPFPGLDRSRIPHYLNYEPNPTSVKNMAHWAQSVRSGTFGRYDYGKDKNLEKYGQAHPPQFNLTSWPEHLPVALFAGYKDALADPKDVALLLQLLPIRAKVTTHYEMNYGHLDPLLGIDAHKRIYPMILDLMEKYRSN